MSAVEISHKLRTASSRVMDSFNKSGSEKQKELNPDMVLANFYQRIPGAVLRMMEEKQPQNYSILEDTSVNNQHPEHCHYDCNPAGKWIPKAVPAGVSLKTVLQLVEAENARNPKLEKVKISFCDGYIVTLRRTNPSLPSSLSFCGEYDPSSKFREATASKAAASRSKLLKRLRFISDDKGRAVRSTSPHESPRSMSPLGVPKPPAPGTAGFAFTPVSMLSFAMRPNEIITGVRPSLRCTNPQAVHYRPRALLHPLTPSVQQHAAGLILDGTLEIDYRNNSTRRAHSAIA